MVSNYQQTRSLDKESLIKMILIKFSGVAHHNAHHFQNLRMRNFNSNRTSDCIATLKPDGQICLINTRVLALGLLLYLRKNKSK